MGSLKDIANQSNIQTFPNAQFVIEGTPPPSQCSDAIIQGDNATTAGPGFPKLTDPGAFAGFALAGKVCHITASVGGNTGDFDIFANNDNQLDLIQDPGNGNPVSYYLTDGGLLVTTHDIEFFAAFISDAGYSYTIKGGKLYTNIPSAALQPACKAFFDPLT